MDPAAAGRGAGRGPGRGLRLDDPEVTAALERWRHLGPGAHPNGTPQSIHAGGLARGAVNGLIELGIRDGSGRLPLPPAARKRIDALKKKWGINEAGMAADADLAFADPKLVEFGRRWYFDEFGGDAQHLVDTHPGLSVEKATGAVAICSARNRWVTDDGTHINMETADAHIAHWAAHPEMTAKELAATAETGYLKGPGFGLNVFEMLTGEKTVDEAVTGSKRRSFHNNGINPEESWDITADVWMGQAVARNSHLTIDEVQGLLGVEPPKYLTDVGVNASPMYVVISEMVMGAHVRHEADTGFTRPHQSQATIWGVMPQLGAGEQA